MPTQSIEQERDGALQEQVHATFSPLEGEIKRLLISSSERSTLGQALDRAKDQQLKTLREHDGMASELLCTYDQLGIVFEMTRGLMTMRQEDDVLQQFIDNLGIIYPDAQLAVARITGHRRVTSFGESDIPDWVMEHLPSCVESGRVCAVHSNHQIGKATDGAALFADSAVLTPISCGGHAAYIIILCRSNKHATHEHFRSVDMLLLDSLCMFCGDLINNFRLVKELQGVAMDTVRTLVNAVDQKDPYTSGHSNRVGYYAKLLAILLEFEEDDLRALEWSALMHDVGKIGIRDDVLKKEGKLTDEEFEHIKEHPVRGYLVVRENPQMRDALDGVLHHHERYDGKGYPDGLKGEDIPLQARVIQIADIFDALTTTRSYRSKFDWRRAISIMEEEAGTVVDPRLCRIFAAEIRRLAKLFPEAFEVIGTANAKLHLTPAIGPSA